MATTRRETGEVHMVELETGKFKAKDGKRLFPAISLVIPTRNEAGNILELVARIERALAGISAEIIFVDDSTDETPQIIRDVSLRSQVSVSLIHRPPDRQGNGLGGAVVEGMRVATGNFICVMDADLQHPPELIQKLLKSARDDGADIVVASRFAESGEATCLGSMRLAVSKLSTFAARLFFPRRLRNVTDALSGFFLVRRDAINLDSLRPQGFKILLEILVRFPHLSVTEIPFSFQSRHSGQSKAAVREGLRYVTLLFRLRFDGGLKRVTRFGLVGASGLIVNSLLVVAFTEIGGTYYLASAALATVGSSLWNFSLTDAWVFGDRPGGQSRLRRLASFLLVNASALLIRGPFLLILTSGLGVHYLVSNLITLLALSAGRYILFDSWIWAGASSGTRHDNFAYDIHGIVRVVSEVRLHELEFFRTSDSVERPDVLIEVGPPTFAPKNSSEAARSNGSNEFRYQEVLGQLGFWVEIAAGEHIDVLVGPLLKRSPHVLYTNVVEPILRWTLVRKGYALVHGACVARDGKAILITALTDTGKTTTILRLLSKHSLAFLSDDMVIIQRDGSLLSYPKPLTISLHTLGAVNGALLSRWERLALKIQSRVHSKSGRKTALLLARMHLPMASVNALAQMLVPPPKYSIERLIPGVEVARKATLSHMAAIERGADLQVSLDARAAEETLLRNCEDAYGFPPYPELKGFLVPWNGKDLQSIERQIISDALGSCAATLVRSQTRHWWEPVLSLLTANQGQHDAIPDGDVPAVSKRKGPSSASTEALEGSP